jgi:uncharacterized protein YkwD
LFISLTSYSQQEWELEQVYELINQVRRENKIRKPIVIDSTLEIKAQQKTESLMESGITKELARHHSSMDNSVGELLFWIERDEMGHIFSVNGWMRSPGHRRILIEKDYKYFGIGIAKSVDKGTYVVLWTK